MNPGFDDVDSSSEAAPPTFPVREVLLSERVVLFGIVDLAFVILFLEDVGDKTGGEDAVIAEIAVFTFVCRRNAEGDTASGDEDLVSEIGERGGEEGGVASSFAPILFLLFFPSV